MENNQVGISVMALYEKFGEKLTYGTIRKTVENEGEYYDLIVEGWKIATCDGEVNEVIDYEDSVFTLKNNEGDFGEITFKLTKEEMEIAFFGQSTKFIGHIVNKHNEHEIDVLIDGYYFGYPIRVFVDIANGNDNVFLIEGLKNDEFSFEEVDIDQSLITNYISKKLYSENGEMIEIA